ncbi:MAG: acyl-CoA dehydrogenase family protein [Alphaproteobacteria bacterium]|nr:acyl-CoA dehydrogenase family protein [Alphaproteobacteria bacterium]
MDFQLNEEQLTIKYAARSFAQNICLPKVIERDEHKTFPYEQVYKLAEQGFLGLMVDPKYGGAGMDSLSYILSIEEISKIDASCGVIMSVNNSLVCHGLEKYGSDYIKENYLTYLAQGIKNGKLYIGAFMLSEPESGSDASAMKTTVKDMGSYYEINGIKNWITNGSTASVYIVLAQSDFSKGAKGINALIVESQSEGISVMSPENKLGIRSSDTCSVIFNNVKVPKENLIGKPDFGFNFALGILDAGRIGIAAQALGIASGAYELALQYAKTRKSFGKQIIQHQAVQFKLVDMLTQIEAARLLTYRAGIEKDSGHAYSIDAAMAKLVASQTAVQVTTESIQIHGGNGYVKDYHVERLYRDAKITQIYEGTSEIQKIVIGRYLMK